MQDSIPPKSDNRAIGGELSFPDAPPENPVFGLLLLLPSTVLDERIFRFPFMFALTSSCSVWDVAGKSARTGEFKFNLFRR